MNLKIPKLPEWAWWLIGLVITAAIALGASDLMKLVISVVFVAAPVATYRYFNQQKNPKALEYGFYVAMAVIVLWFLGFLGYIQGRAVDVGHDLQRWGIGAFILIVLLGYGRLNGWFGNSK